MLRGNFTTLNTQPPENDVAADGAATPGEFLSTFRTAGQW